MAVVKNLMVRVGADLSPLTGELARASGRLKDLGATGKDAGKDAAAGLRNIQRAMEGTETNKHIVHLRDQIAELEAQQKSLQALGYDWGYQTFEENDRAIRSMKSELQDYITDLRNPAPVEQARGAFGQLKHAMEEAGGAGAVLRTSLGTLGGFTVRGLGLAARGVQAIGSRALSAAKGGVGLLRSGLGAIGRGALGGLRAAGSAIGSIFTHARRARSGVGGLASSIKSVGAVAIGLRLASAAMGRLRSLVSSAISGNAALEAQVSSLKSALGQALTPAIGLVTQALSMLMPYIVGVSNAFGSLMTNLFGSGWTSVASGASAAAEATQAATAAQKEYERQVLGFDEITKLSSSSSGSGGSGGGGSSGDISTTPIEGKLPNWLKELTGQIRSAIDEGDWEGVGAILAGKLGDAVDSARGKLNSSAFRNKVSSLVGHVTDTINGFFGKLTEEDGQKTSIAENIGGLIGDGVGLALNTVHQFLTEVKWDKIGTAVGQAINGALKSLTANDINFGTILGDLFSAGVSGAGAAIKKVDWSLLGSYVATNIRSALGSISTTVQNTDWAGMGSAIVSGINSLVSGLGGEINLGTTLGTIINGALGFIGGAISSADWSGWGSTIAANINGFVSTVDWSSLGGTLSNGFKSALGTISTAIREIDWAGIGTSIRDFIAGIDWAGIASGLADTMGSLAGGLVTALWGAFGDEVTQIKKYFGNKIDEAGGNVVEGILNGIVEGLSNIGAWIRDNIFQPFLSGFKSTFGIHSPATNKEIVGLGTNIIQGVFNGVISWMGGIGTWVQEHIFQPFRDAVNKIDPTEIGNTIKGWLEEKTGNVTVNVSDVTTSLGSTPNKAGFTHTGGKFGMVTTANVTDTDTGSLPAAKRAIDKMTGKITEAKAKDGYKAMVESSAMITGGGQAKTGYTTPLVAAMAMIFGGGQAAHGYTKPLINADAMILGGGAAKNGYKQPTLPATANFVQKQDLMKMSQKRVETTANFVQKIDSMKMAAKLLETKANFTSKQDSMKMEQKLLEAKAKFTQKQDSLTGTDKTFSTVANFSNYLDNLKDSQRTFGTIAAFNDYTTGGISGDNKPCANAIADFNDYNWYEIQNQNSLGVWAYGKVYFNEYEDLTGATWEHTTGEGRYSKASGGVYAGGRWHNIAQYASGTAGAPAGQLFIAREAGPELVGTLGGHTAVMNNNQIVASVSAGVARAIAGIKFRMSAPRTAAASAGSLDDLAERFAERMARVLRREDTGGSTDRRPIVVQMVLDGRVIGEKSVEYIRDEAKRGNFPLAEAI